MPINVLEPFSPGWWLQRLVKKLTNPQRVKRLELLADHLRGEPPLPVPVAAPALRVAYNAFQRKARSNFADLVVSATRERMAPNGFRTGADGDETGDAEAWRIWQRAGLDVESVDVHRAMLGMSEAYVIVGPVSAVTGVPVITFEDPRQVVTVQDPAQRDRSLAGVKLFYDDVEEVTRAFLYLPGRVYCAVSSSRARRAVAFSPTTWSWDQVRGGVEGQQQSHDQLSVVRFANYAELGEFEPHIDLLDRINHQILQRMVIATMQAFRQRAAKNLPETDAAGNPIDYSEVFSADPGALWQLPADVEMWESGQADLTPILTAVDRDVQHLAAVTRTPMQMLMPAGANQSAEGAAFQREGLVFKTQDRIARATQGWAQVMSLAFRVMGDDARADLDKLQVIWRSPERRSLAERADAFSKLSSEKLPYRMALIDVLEVPADQADRIQSERLADALQASILAPPPAELPPATPPAGADDADAG